MDQLCVACSRLHPRESTSCECGHVLKDSVFVFDSSTGRDLAYRTRKSVSCPSSSSSGSLSPLSKHEKEKFHFMQDTGLSHKKHKTYNNNHSNNNNEIKKKTRKFPRIIYRCKSYKKAKSSEMNNKFDFSLFDSHDPCYPNALSDINEKIGRQNSLYRILESL